MAQAVDIRVLVVGAPHELTDGIRDALNNEDFQPVLHATDDRSATELALEAQPKLVIMDYSRSRSKAEALAEKLRGVSPGSWVMDFSGALRRRPEQAQVRLERTVPFLLEGSSPAG
jgi:DNA-binding NarL/FixJ family response regulator